MSRSDRRPRRTLGTLLVAVLAATIALVSAGPQPAAATPPGIPTAATAQAELNALVVASEAPMTGYSRALFPHWTTSGGCTARQTVLQRDGIDVTVDASCQPVAGRWYSPYDNRTLYSAAEVDIDHVVPLAEAWRSGAHGWTTDRRRAFANDLSGPQLRAASATSNRAKGDQDPSLWRPRTAYHCTYSKMWIRTKYRWNLMLQPAERTALQNMLNTC